jgi:hypothetical protein
VKKEFLLGAIGFTWAAGLTVACNSTPTDDSPVSLCGEVCEKGTPCQPHGSVPLCVNYCEKNAEWDRAIGCGRELEAFQRCMSNNIVCKDGDIDFVHVAEACEREGDALMKCELADGGAPDAGVQ